MKYYLAENGQPAGPFTVSELLQRGLTVNSQVWCEGMANWQPAGQVAELAAALANTGFTPTGTPIGQTANPTGMSLPQQNAQVNTQFPQQPLPQQQPPYSSGPTTNQPYAQPQYQQTNQLMPKTWLTEAVILTVLSASCCCNPVALVTSIVAIFKANSVKSKFMRGDTMGANTTSKSAKMWVLISIAIIVIWIAVQTYRLMTNPEYLQQIIDAVNTNMGVNLGTF